MMVLAVILVFVLLGGLRKPGPAAGKILKGAMILGVVVVVLVGLLIGSCFLSAAPGTRGDRSTRRERGWSMRPNREGSWLVGDAHRRVRFLGADRQRMVGFAAANESC